MRIITSALYVRQQAYAAFYTAGNQPTWTPTLRFPKNFQKHVVIDFLFAYRGWLPTRSSLGISTRISLALTWTRSLVDTVALHGVISNMEVFFVLHQQDGLLLSGIAFAYAFVEYDDKHGVSLPVLCLPLANGKHVLGCDSLRELARIP